MMHTWSRVFKNIASSLISIFIYYLTFYRLNIRNNNQQVTGSVCSLLTTVEVVFWDGAINKAANLTVWMFVI